MNRSALLLTSAWLFAGCSDSCIAEGTWVSTPKGRTPVERLRVGDSVYSVDTETGALVEVSITHVRSAVRESLSLELDSHEMLRCSSNHPIFDPQTQTYRPASDWITGDARQLLQIVEGRPRVSEVLARSAYAGLVRVFDLTVSGPHSNFIAEGVVVHNKSYTSGNDVETETGDPGAWFEDLEGVACPAAIPVGGACLEVGGVEYFLPTSTARFSELSSDIVLRLEFTNPDEAEAPRLSITYPEDATGSEMCVDYETTVTISWSLPDGIRQVDTYINERFEPEAECTVSLPDTPPMLGAVVSGSVVGVAEGDSQTLAFDAEWLEVEVIE